jgi:hypothetical protein
MKGRMSKKIEALDDHREFHADHFNYGRTSVLETMLY